MDIETRPRYKYELLVNADGVIEFFALDLELALMGIVKFEAEDLDRATHATLARAFRYAYRQIDHQSLIDASDYAGAQRMLTDLRAACTDPAHARGESCFECSLRPLPLRRPTAPA